MRTETGFDHSLYDRFPTSDPRPEGELEELERIWCAPKGWQLLTAVNNNYIGIFYVGAAFLFFLLAGILALVMRVQLALPLQGILPQDADSDDAAHLFRSDGAHYSEPMPPSWRSL